MNNKPFDIQTVLNKIYDEATQSLKVHGDGAGGAGESVWGDINGELSNQTDLKDALDAKASNAELTEHVGNTALHVSLSEKEEWNAKMDAPTGGTDGQVLTKTSTGSEWADAPAGGGDMLKAVYDLNDDGTVDYAEKLRTARAIGEASFDGSADISLAQIGAQPTLPAGDEGLYLKKTADGVGWDTPPTGDLSNYATKTALEEGLAGKADSSHTHTTSDVTGLDDVLATKANTQDVADALAYFAPKATNLAGYGITDAYTKFETDAKMSAVYRYKGSCSSYAMLPASDRTVGDVWNVSTADPEHGIKAGDNVAWTGTEWDVLSGTVDLTPYALKADAATDHNHDGAYAAKSHTHAVSDVTGLQESLEGKAASSHTHAQADVTGLVSALSSLSTSVASKADASHTHKVADVNNLQTALDGKAASSHTHTTSDVTGLQDALNAKITSPETGTTGQVLTKTASGVEWADASTGGEAATWGGITGEISDQTDLKDALAAKLTAAQPTSDDAGKFLMAGAGSTPSWVKASELTITDPDAVRKVVDAPTLEAAQSTGNDIFVTAGNEFEFYNRQPVWSLRAAGSPLNDRLLRGHMYRRIKTSSSSGTSRQVTVNTYKIKMVYLYNKDNGAYSDKYGLFVDTKDTPLKFNGSFTFTDREYVDSSSNNGWPSYEISPEAVAAQFLDSLQQEGTYIGITPGFVLQNGGAGDVIKWTANGWRKCYVSLTSSGEVSVTPYDIYYTIKLRYADPTDINNYSETPLVYSSSTVTETRSDHWLNPTDNLLDITPTIMSIEELASADAITVWPCRAYKLALVNDTVLTAEGGVTGDIPDFSDNTGNVIDRDIRQESFIDINPGSYTVSADNNTLVIVDEITPNVVNHCRIVWTGQLARLYVYEAELPTFQTGDWYIEGTVNEELSVDLSTKVFSLPSTITPVFTPRPGYALPSGLSLSPSGMLTGTPTIATSTGGVINVFTTYVVVSAPGYMDSRVKLEFEIAQQGTITTTPQTINGIALVALDDVDANLGKAVSVSNKREAQYALATDSTLPEGLSLSRAGILSGRPSTSGETTTNITVSARGCPDATLTVTFQIAKGTITTKNSSITGVVDSPISEGAGVLDSTVASTNNGQRCFFAVAEGSTLPGGLTLVNPTSISSVAKITGTPTTAGRTEVTFNVTAEQCTPATVVITFSIADNIPEGTIAASDQTVNGTKGESLTAQLAASASNSMTCTFALAEGASLPSGINMEATGKITGAPAAAGTSAVKVKISARNCPDVEITITFNIADSVPDGTITVTTNPTIQGVVGTAISTYNLASCVTVSNGQTPSFRWNDVYSPQPSWLTLTTSGTLSGTPTSIPSPTDGKVLVSANKCSNEPNIIITWDIIAAGVITVSDQTIKGTVGTALSSFNLYDLTEVSNNQTPTFAVKSGNTLPEGIALSSDGVFTGTPSATSSATVVVQIAARGCPTKDVNITFDITEAQAGSDDFPVSFTVTESQGLNGQDCLGTYTRTGNTLALDGVNYPVYSFTNASGKVHYIHISKWVYEGQQVLGTSWILDTRTSFTAESPIRVQEVYGTSRLKAETYEPSSTYWNGDMGAVVVSWEMGGGGLTGGADREATAFGNSGSVLSTSFQAVLQKYTYTGTFPVAGETFPYFTGNGSTPWYLFGGKVNEGHYALYLYKYNPTTSIFAWNMVATSMNENSTDRLLMLGKSGSELGTLTKEDVTGDLPATLLSAAKWWTQYDSGYDGTQVCDTIVWS